MASLNEARTIVDAGRNVDRFVVATVFGGAYISPTREHE